FVMDLVDTSKSLLGLGGMSSKLTFAKLATKTGIKVTIFGLRIGQGGILKSFKGEAGSTFEPSEVNLSARNKWLVSGGLTAARIMIDDGAVHALVGRNSLLAVGIKEVLGVFDKGEIIEILDTQGQRMAVARSRVSSSELVKKIKNQVVAHADDIVLV
ncbi:MAG: glutamate 5-kinase, partial [Arcticibacterium sp.]